jgi:hypothetical protein
MIIKLTHVEIQNKIDIADDHMRSIALDFVVSASNGRKYISYQEYFYSLHQNQPFFKINWKTK